MNDKWRSIISVVLSFVLTLGLLPGMSLTAYAEEETAAYTAKLTFSDSAVEETESGAGYTIDGTALSITASGTYDLTGSCSEGSVVVKTSDVTLLLDGLTLSSSSTAPIVVKKSCSNVNIHVVDDTTNTITNNEDPANETSSDETVADAFEGACIKVKTDSAVTFCGGGNLVCVANTKNGIKGGTNASLTFNTTGDITVKGNYSGYATSAGAVNNAIASDGSLEFNAGTYNVSAANDGIKAVPDSDDTTSAGNITINGGTFNLNVDGDGIQAEQNLTISAGTFDIRTMTGYNDNSFNEDTMSCKGIKASGDREDIENTIMVTGGDFTLNTADDAIHSDMYVQVTGGTFDINTGDDGIHADTSLVLGTDEGLERDPDINITNCYEGLEAGTLYIYSGRHYVCAEDDGVNAAGGSSSGSNTGDPRDSFKPGGGGPGSQTSTSSSDYNIYIYGGELYVNCDGDGLDSNGGLYLKGGKQWVFSQGGNGDNSAIDVDGTVSIDGATILTAGLAGMDGSAQSGWFGSNQKYKTASSNYSANTNLNAKAGNSIMLSARLPKKVSYVMASWPSAVSSTAPTFATASSLTSCKSDSRNHDWNEGSTTDDVITYTCATCGSTERQTAVSSASVSECDHSVEAKEITEYTATFSLVDENGSDSTKATINTYYTQDYTEASETNVTTALARNSDTGEVDVSGSGQINFTVVPEDGYSVSDVSVEGSYKNLKDVSDTDLANTYRITKVAGDLTVTITLKSDETGSGSISYETSEVTKTYGDEAFTNTLSKTGDGSVTYASDTESVATVDASTGEVTIKGVGSATITATVEDSDTYTYEIKTASYTLIVNEAEETEPAITERTGSWVKDQKGWWYSYSDGTYPKNCFDTIDGKIYHFDASGYMQTGWQKIDGYWYYFATSGAMQTGWQKISGVWYYMNADGVMQTGWQKIDGVWYYMNGSGAMQTGWQKIGGTWYYMNGSGAMQTGWFKYGRPDLAKWYYLAGSGAMQTGWQKIDGVWYYFNGNGEMQTGWQKIGGTWYYMNGSGAMQTGWLKYGNAWYYLASSGAMQTGWQKIDNTWYYFYSSGAMAANKWVGNYYLTGSGAMATNTWIGNYYVGDDGKWIPGYTATN